MSNNDWQGIGDAEQIIMHLRRGKYELSERRLRLIAVACCRRIWDLIPGRQRDAVEAAERFAEGEAVPAEDWELIVDNAEEGVGSETWEPVAHHVRVAVRATFRENRLRPIFSECASARAWAEVLAGREDLCRDPDQLLDLAHWGPFAYWGSETEKQELSREYEAARSRELKEQLLLVADVFGAQLHGLTIPTLSRTPAVAALARIIYDEQSYKELPILGDALEETGCTNEEVLSHCRDSGPHVRGCWVVDLLLDKP